jgi:Ethanolamine utilization protein EutJ (predicted chaperonin)
MPKIEDARYIVGIDLGTTNCVASYADARHAAEGKAEVLTLKIPQVTRPGVVEAAEFLPSFYYIPSKSELPPNSLALPWRPGMANPVNPANANADADSADNAAVADYAVGIFALERGASVPIRLVSSAKSWLCHPGVDKTNAILPWNAPDDVRKISPLEASSAYLEHIRRAWDHTMSEGRDELRLENQAVYLAVPASFDAAARQLTVEAAQTAGIGRVTLIEEPQAAFYSWLFGRGDAWRRDVTVGDVVLVCDIGGGTTDFSLIEVAEEGGQMTLKRIAVGEHILVGGDNMDLTMAYAARAKFTAKGITPDAWQMLGLVHNCRQAKEKMLSDASCQSHPVSILGRGRGVVGGTLQAELLRSDIDDTILEGFFPRSDINDAPMEKKSSGFRQLGLHYSADSAVTRHMAKFLRRHAVASEGSLGKTFLHPTKILFNGGVTKAAMITRRIVEVLDAWLEAEGGRPVTILGGDGPDTADIAVAVGASYYGCVRTGGGVRVRGGTGMSYYIGVETPMPAVPGVAPPIKAVCVAPFGMEEGTEAAIPGGEFGLVVGEHSTFRFFASTVRKKDAPGTAVESWDEEEIVELSPIETTLAPDGEVLNGDVVPVRIRACLTEIGTLELWCETPDGKNRWKLELNVRHENPDAS